MPVTDAATFCATLVDEWVRAGVTDAVVAPGSRSTPLALALAADSRVRLQVHHDERSAAFVALGIGLAIGRPAVLLCTSGTAAANFHPAVIEAHQSAVPLIVCTADRPPELHGIGAAQTVDQRNLYGTAVRRWFDAGVPSAATASDWRSIASRTVADATTTGEGPGPVHLNLPFRDPLVGDAGPLPLARPDGRPWHEVVSGAPILDAERIAGLARLLDQHRGVIIAGAGCGDPTSVHALAASLGWPVLADPRSGCRTPELTTVGAFDALLRHERFAADHTPTVVLRIGRPPASKVLAQWLAGSGADQVQLSGSPAWIDPDRNATVLVHADVTATTAALASTLYGRGGSATPWLARWAHAERRAQEALDAAIADLPDPTEPGTARSLVASLPEGSTLVVSSSMPARDVEWYGRPRTGLRVLSNRGANGIDGVTSTAVGVAVANQGHPTALLIGDIAFLHDANGLLGAAARGIDLTIVVVDNAGGGIFSFLPQASALTDERFELLFGTPHDVSIPTLAAAHGVPVSGVDRADELAPAVTEAVAAGGVRLLHVRTDRAANVTIHAQLHTAVRAAL